MQFHLDADTGVFAAGALADDMHNCIKHFWMCERMYMYLLDLVPVLCCRSKQDIVPGKLKCEI